MEGLSQEKKFLTSSNMAVMEKLAQLMSVMGEIQEKFKNEYET